MVSKTAIAAFVMLVLLPAAAKAECPAGSDLSKYPGCEAPYGNTEFSRRLERERQETALAREQAERARLRGLEHSYESQARMQEIYERQAEQSLAASTRNSTISTVGQAANTVANIAAQSQYLGRGGGGW